MIGPHITEKDLCDKIKADALAKGFRVFPEYGKWDLVLERRLVLFGVQAKLELNKKVIAQCLVSDDVHFKIIIVPEGARLDQDFILIASKLRLLLFTCGEEYIFSGLSKNIFRYRQKPKQLIQIPDFDYDLPAGVRSPRKVGERNIAYCKLEKIARAKGYILAKDAYNLGIDKIPNMYFKYDWNDRNWKLRGINLPSKQWPHIWENLNG